MSAMTGFGPRGHGPRAVDFEGNLNLIRVTDAEEGRRFVLVSIHGATADHPTELVRMKHAAEESLRRSRLDWVIVRPTVFMQLWVGIVWRHIANVGKARVFGQGDNPINFACEGDVAQFVVLALFDPGLSRTVIDVGGPENVTFKRIGRTDRARHPPQSEGELCSSSPGVCPCLLVRPFRPDIARHDRSRNHF